MNLISFWYQQRSEYETFFWNNILIPQIIPVLHFGKPAYLEAVNWSWSQVSSATRDSLSIYGWPKQRFSYVLGPHWLGKAATHQWESHPIIPTPMDFLYSFLFLVLGIELMTSHFPSRHLCHWAKPLPLYTHLNKKKFWSLIKTQS